MDGAQLVPAWPELELGLHRCGASTRGAASCPALFPRACQAAVPRSRTVSPASPAVLGGRHWWLYPRVLELCQPFVSHTWLTAETVMQQNPPGIARLPSSVLKGLGMIHSASVSSSPTSPSPRNLKVGWGKASADPATHPCPSCTFRTPQPRSPLTSGSALTPPHGGASPCKSP